MQGNMVSNEVTAATYVGSTGWRAASGVVPVERVGGVDLGRRGRRCCRWWDGGGQFELDDELAVLAGAGGARGFVAGGGAAEPVSGDVGRSGGVRDYAELCVQYRLTVLVPDSVMRMEVRLLWFKRSWVERWWVGGLDVSGGGDVVARGSADGGPGRGERERGADGDDVVAEPGGAMSTRIPNRGSGARASRSWSCWFRSWWRAWR